MDNVLAWVAICGRHEIDKTILRLGKNREKSTIIDGLGLIYYKDSNINLFTKQYHNK